MQNSLKEKISSGDFVIGTWISFSDPACMEILCHSGFDFLVIDVEHAPISDEALRNLIMVSKGSDTTVLVRVRTNEPSYIGLPLDLGAAGVMVPLVNSLDEAHQAVRAAKYPPDGIRSIGAWRPSGYYADSWGYVQRANQESIIMLQVEHIQAVNKLDEILEVQGIDAIFIGPADLSASLNRFPEKLHPESKEALTRIAAYCEEAKMPFGADGTSVMDFLVPLGATILTTGIDTCFLMDAAKSAVVKARDTYGA